MLRAAPDLLVVEERDQAQPSGRLCALDSLEAGEDGGEVVEPGRGDEFIGETQEAARFMRVDAEIVGEDRFFLCAAGGGEPGEEEVSFLLVSFEEGSERQHVFLRVQCAALVDVPVHVDGEAGDCQERFLKVDETHFGLESVLAAQHDLSRKRERAVEPCAQDESAVCLDVERAVAVARHAGCWLQTKAWEIRVRRRHAQRCAAFHGRFFPDGEGEERRAVDAEEVASAGSKMPRVVEPQLPEARTAEALGALGDDVEG